MTEPMLQSGGPEPESEESMSDLANTDCAQFQASMPQRIGDGEDLQANPHMLTCERCRSLVNELEAIADAARQLMQDPDSEPGEDLWSKIERKLALEVPDSSADHGAPDERRLDERGLDERSEGDGLSLESGLALEGGIA